jgi:hypothetical protein
MALDATLSARKSFFLWESLSASMIAAGKPLPQKKYHLARKKIKRNPA